MLKSTYEVLQRRIAAIKEKLVNEMPERLRQTYETGGYWHDNALWEDALREQEVLNRELSLLLTTLKDATFIENFYPLLDGDKVTIGKTIKVENIATKEIAEYSIVGPADTTYNPISKENNFVAYKAPLVQPLLGKSIGEEVTIKLPGGTRTLVVLEIKPLTIWESTEVSRG